MTNSVAELADAKLIFAVGTNTTETHPVLSIRVKEAVRKGAKLIVADPRKIELTRWATRHLPLHVGTDTALLVPKDALRYLYGVYKVYAVEEKKLRETEVKLGRREGDEAEIVDGLKEGDRVAVAVEGDDLRDGAPLAAAEQGLR